MKKIFLNNKRIQYVKQILGYSSDKGRHVTGIIGCRIFAIILSVLTPVFYNIFINNVLTKRQLKLFIAVACGYAGVFVLQCINSFINKRVYNTFLINILRNVKSRLLNVCLNMKTKDYKAKEIGDVKNVLENDINSIDSIINTHCLDYFYQYIYGIILLVIMLIMSWKLTLISIVMIPVSFLFTKVMSKKSKRTSDEHRKAFGEYESFVWGELYNYKEVKSNNLEDTMVGMFKSHWDVIGRLFVKLQMLWFANRTFVSVKDFFIVKMNLYFIGGLLIIYNNMELATLLVFMNYYGSFFNAVSVVMEDKIQFTSEETKLEHIFDILEYKSEDGIETEIEGNKISIENVSFKYQEDQRTVLKNVSLEIGEHESVAIVGRSGCGKTTLVNLIYRMYDPDEGIIKIGEKDIRGISSMSYGKKLSVVLQEPCFFNNTIRYNLLLADRNADDEKLFAALKKVMMDDFIRQQPDGLDTIIGENGIKLSGGQRQRLALARCFLHECEIIILDEATSALDSENEMQLMSVLKELKKEKTIIFISHRFSTICNADKIFVMDEGRIVAQGSHSTLKNNCGLYDSLFSKQFGEVLIDANT